MEQEIAILHIDVISAMRQSKPYEMLICQVKGESTQTVYYSKTICMTDEMVAWTTNTADVEDSIVKEITMVMGGFNLTVKLSNDAVLPVIFPHLLNFIKGLDVMDSHNSTEDIKVPGLDDTPVTTPKLSPLPEHPTASQALVDSLMNLRDSIDNFAKELTL